MYFDVVDTPLTAAQVARLLGIPVEPAEAPTVTTARIRDRAFAALGEDAPEPATARQRAYAETLGLDVVDDTKRVSSAKIAEALRSRNLRLIAKMDLAPGDRVACRHVAAVGGAEPTWETEEVVSSIAPDGRVWFKGGQGKGAFPDRLRKLKPDSDQPGQPRAHRGDDPGIKVTLHEELVVILQEGGVGWVSTQQLADQVNARGRYHKKDGGLVTAFQVHGRTRNYPDLFERDGSRVRLHRPQTLPDGSGDEA